MEKILQNKSLPVQLFSLCEHLLGRGPLSRQRLLEKGLSNQTIARAISCNILRENNQLGGTLTMARPAQLKSFQRQLIESGELAVGEEVYRMKNGKLIAATVVGMDGNEVAVASAEEGEEVEIEDEENVARKEEVNDIS